MFDMQIFFSITDPLRSVR